MSELVFPWTTPQALNSSDRRESRAGIFEADRLVLGRFGTGSGELLRGTSDSSIISLWLPGFFDIVV